MILVSMTAKRDSRDESKSNGVNNAQRGEHNGHRLKFAVYSVKKKAN